MYVKARHSSSLVAQLVLALGHVGPHPCLFASGVVLIQGVVGNRCYIRVHHKPHRNALHQG